jgi:hypothetical protein
MLLDILDNEFVTVQLDDSVPVLMHRWKQEPPAEEFQFILKRILAEYQALSKSHRKLAWLVDAALLGELDQEVENWLQNEWEQLLFVETGVKIHAVILGRSIYADYPMEKPEAYTWIRQQQLKL